MSVLFVRVYNVKDSYIHVMTMFDIENYAEQNNLTS